ncbi:MAG: hypothetical protein PHO15_01870, partial [Eubacteriales bacterium]|nr:hypothetical protein [Eubacteriales bacterium]
GLKAFHETGGQEIFFIDSMSVDETTVETEYVANDLANFGSLLLMYDMSVNNDVVIGGDPSKTFRSPVSIIPVPNSASAITVSLAEGGRNPVLSYASSIDLLNTVGASVTTLLETDASCYVKTPDKTLGGLDMNAGDDTGIFVVGAMAQNEFSTVVLYTSSSFVVSEENYRHRSNALLFLNTLNYLNQKMDSVQIPMKTVYAASDDAYKLDITSNIQKIFYIVIAAGALPIIVMLLGVTRWLKRSGL